MIDWNRRDWAVLLAVTSLAALLRFYQLGVVPPGFQFDEAFNALDAARVLDGARPLFLPDNGGREVLYTYLQAGLAALLGLSVYTLRLTSALAGIVTVPAVYLLLRGMLRVASRPVAAFTSVVLAISFWHLHFSHYGIRVILMPLLLSGVFGFFWLGTRRGQIWPFLLSGALAGLSVWTHPSGRLTPLVLIGYTLYLLWVRRRANRSTPHPSTLQSPKSKIQNPIVGLALTGIAAFVVFLPLGIHFYRYPILFLGHASDVSVFTERVNQGSPLAAVLRHSLEVAGMFSWRGDRETIHNLPGRPVFDPLLSIPFWLGAIVWAMRLGRRDDPDRDALALLMLWGLIMLLPSVFSDAAPNFSRTLPALPALFVAAGLGLTAIVDFRLPILDLPFSDQDSWSSQEHLRPSQSKIPNPKSTILVAGILVASLGLTVRDYFVRFPQQPLTYYLYDTDKLDAWAHLRPLTPDHQVYLSQLWAEHATFDFLKKGSSVKSLDTSDTIVLPPPGRSAVYAFPPEQHERAEELAALWPGATVRQVLDPYGRPLLETVTLDAGLLRDWPSGRAPEQPVEARFDGGPTLLGMQAEGGQITLFWRAEGPISRSLTSFVHLVDRAGRRVGQNDKLPGNGSYLTPGWTAGERVIERYRPEIDACAGGQEVRVLAGWYDLSADGARTPRADAPGDVALAGRMLLPLRSRPPEQLNPPTTLNLPLMDGLDFLGYGLDTGGGALQAGSPLTLDLYWRGDPSAAYQPLAVTLQPAGNETGSVLLWHGAIVPDGAEWRPGEAICSRLELRLPADIAAGTYQLQAQVAGHAPALGDLHVEPSTRRFDLAATAIAIDASLTNEDAGDGTPELRLAGADLVPPAAPGEPLTLTLTWQALATPESNYHVFVHLVAEDGEIVAQSDAAPAGGYATRQWLSGEVVLDRHRLAVPEGSAEGARYRLFAGMYDPVTGRRLAAWDRAQNRIAQDAIPIGEVAIP